MICATVLHSCIFGICVGMYEPSIGVLVCIFGMSVYRLIVECLGQS